MSNTDLGTATFRIEGDASGARQAANETLTSMQQLEVAVAQGWWGIQNLGLAFAALPTAVAAGVGMAVKSAMDLEDAIADVAKTTYEAAREGETEEQANLRNAEALATLKDELLAVAAVKPVATVEIFGIAEAAGALGVAQEDIAEFTSVVSDLAATTDLTSDVAAESLARIAALTNVPAAGFDNLASAILDAGRTTAATESQIVSLATRLAPAASVVRLTADEIVALAAATASAGIRTEMGATALQKSILDINRAVGAGGEALQGFADIAGENVGAFAEMWQESPREGIEAFINGLARMIDNGEDAAVALSDLGITEARQQQTLLALAAAQNQTANESLKLSNIFEDTAKSFRDGTSLAEITEERYKTLSSQIQILRNQIFAMASAFGEHLLPVLAFVTDRISDFLTGINALPGPVRAIMVVVVALTAAFLGLIGVALLVGPRMVLMISSAKQLIAVYNGARANANSFAGALLYIARSADQSAAAQQRAAGATTAAGNAAQAAAAKQVTLGGAMRRAAKGGAVLTAVMSALAIGTTLFGGSISDSAEDAAQSATAIDGLIQALERTDSPGHARGMVDDILQIQLAQEGAMETAERLGFTYQDLFAIISGSASENDTRVFANALQEAAESGDEDAQKLLNTVQALQESFRLSADEAMALGATEESIQAIIDAVANVDPIDAGVEEKSQEEIEQYRDAVYGLMDAQRGLRDANQRVEDAEQSLAEARSDSARSADEIASAEIALQRARLNQAEAADRVRSAERDIATARDRQARAVIDAEIGLRDARRSHADAVDRVREVERELNNARESSSTEDELEATLALLEAQKDLRDANQSVADSQWYLNYLREEGAGERDIIKAQNGLSDAQLDVLNATKDVSDAQKEYQDIISGNRRQEELARLERELADARDRVTSSSLAIRDAEEELAAARSDQANDVLYREAQRELEEALLGQREAAIAVRDAEQELQDVRNPQASSDVARAEEDLADALWDQAAAQVELIKQKALLRGDIWTDSDEANAYADALESIKDGMPAGPQRRELEQFIALLREVEDAVPESEGGGLEGLPGGVPGGMGDAIPLPEIDEDAVSRAGDEQGKKGGELWGKHFTAGFTGALPGVFSGNPFLAAIGFAVGMIGSTVQTVLADVPEGQSVWTYLAEGLWRDEGSLNDEVTERLSSFGKWLWGQITDMLWPDRVAGIWDGAFEIGRDIVEGVREGIDFMMYLITDWPGEVWEEIKEKIREVFRMRSPSRAMAELGWDIVLGLLAGMREKIREVLSWLTGLPGRFFTAVGDVLSTLAQKGRDLLGGLKDGASEKWDEINEWLLGRPQAAIDAIGDLAETLMQKGSDLLHGFLRGLSDKWTSIHDWIERRGEVAITAAGNLLDTLKQKGSDLLHGFLRGLSNKWTTIHGWIQRRGKVVKTAIGDLSELLWQTGRDVVGGFWNGLKEKFEEIKEPVAGVWGWVKDKANDVFGNNSPSKVFRQIGNYVADGLRIGLEEGMVKTVASFEDAVRGIDPALLEDQFRQFGLDGYTFEAFTGGGRPPVGVPAAPVVPGGAQVPEKVIERTEPHYHLEAITAANPQQIFAEFAWGEKIRTRGNVR